MQKWFAALSLGIVWFWISMCLLDIHVDDCFGRIECDGVVLLGMLLLSDDEIA